MNIQKAKYNQVLSSVVPVGETTAGDIRNAAIVILVASLFNYENLSKDEFNNKMINLESLVPVRDLINKINELYPIAVDTVIQNSAALIIKTARSTFGCTHAIAYGYNEFANTLDESIRPDLILSNTALINAAKYADSLIDAIETQDKIVVSNEGCNCVSVSY